MAYEHIHTTGTHTAKRHLVSALSLFVLAPLVGEFLLGNLPITWRWALLSLAPLYGGGALLIREVTRRLRLGWSSMMILGLVYAMIEEAFVTQSLFNPNFVGLRLLDYGYISSLDIGAWWTVFVLAIHTIWSTAVPIALVEGMTPTARTTPWIGLVGLAITALVFAIGCAATFCDQRLPFWQAPMGDGGFVTQNTCSETSDYRQQNSCEVSCEHGWRGWREPSLSSCDHRTRRTFTTGCAIWRHCTQTTATGNP